MSPSLDHLELQTATRSSRNEAPLITTQLQCALRGQMYTQGHVNIIISRLQHVVLGHWPVVAKGPSGPSSFNINNKAAYSMRTSLARAEYHFRRRRAGATWQSKSRLIAASPMWGGLRLKALGLKRCAAS